MNDRQFITIFASFVLIFVATIATLGGSYLEHNRIYQRCLNQNATMVYSDARAFCVKLTGSKNET